MISVEKSGLTTIDIWREAHAPGNHAKRLERIRQIAPRFKERFMQDRPVVAVRTLPVSMAPYHVTYAFNRACKLPFKYLMFQNRALVVRFWQKGEQKTLLMNPTIPSRSIEAPFFKNLNEGLPFAATIRNVLLESPSIPQQLASLRLNPSDIDYVAFDHQHVQDLRPYLGTHGTPPLYPKAKFLVQRADYEACLDQHPLQKMWFVPHGGDDVNTEKLVLLDGDVQLGEGCALLYTPGHTWGNQSLYFRAPESGCYTVSENGICVDAYCPENSEIPGLASHARKTGEEVILNGNTLEGALDQYNSMVKEKLLADRCAKDARFVQHFSSSELIHSPIAPGLRATHAIKEVNEGTLG